VNEKGISLLAWGLAAMIVWLSLCTCSWAESLPDGFPTRRGPLVFFWARVLAQPDKYASEFEWVSKFDLLVTNGQGLASPATRQALQRRGCKLFIYFWTNGFYKHKVGATLQDGTWRTEIATDHLDWLLSPETLPSNMGPPAYYFDLTNDELVEYLCEHLACFRARTGYDGIFFDYAASYALPEPVAELWDKLHPDVPYDRAVAGFLRRLRAKDPDILIFTNQVYRATEPVLPDVDYDMTESSGTSWAWGPMTQVDDEEIRETYFRPWPGKWGIEGIYGNIEHHLTTTPPRKGFVYLDYMQPLYHRSRDGELVPRLDREAVYYSYCAAALWGRPSYCSGLHGGIEYRGPLYFADLGEPLGTGYRELAGVVVREYERGLVVLMKQPHAVSFDYTLQQPTSGHLYDLFSSRWIRLSGNRVSLRLRPSRGRPSGTARPAGRVYLKADPN